MKLTNSDNVTAAWQQIHADHPELYGIANPRLITRMRHRDFAKVVREVCMLHPGSRILEAGCGSGRDTLFFSHEGFQCTAVDINESPLRKLKFASEILSTNRFGRPLQLGIQKADIFHLPFPDSTFDLVFNSGVVEHYDEPTRLQLVREMLRVTKPGGFLSLVFPNKDHILEKYWHRLISAWTDFDAYDIPEQPIRSDIVDRLAQADATVVLFDWIDCYDTISHFPSWWPLRMIGYAATVCLPRIPRRLRSRLGTRGILIALKQPLPQSS